MRAVTVILPCLAAAQLAGALTCIPGSTHSGDTLNPVGPVVEVSWTSSLYATPPNSVVHKDTISPARLLPRLTALKDSFPTIFLGNIKSRTGTVLQYNNRVDTLSIEVETVLKGSIQTGTHRVFDTVGTWDINYQELVGKKVLWFVKHLSGPRNSSTVAPRGPCGGDLYGHPLSGDRVSEYGIYADYGIYVPLSSVFSGLRTREAPGPQMRQSARWFGYGWLLDGQVFGADGRALQRK